MGEIANFSLQPIVALGWLLQLALILAVGLRGAWAIQLREPSISFCLLVVALGWVWRLAYLFAIHAGGFQFWIGDETVRWLDAWLWLRDPYLAAPEKIWLSGTSYAHGAAMWLVGDPLIASKLLSALLCVFPLAGLLVFTQAIFRSRGLAVVSVAFLAPSWLDSLLATGPMSEMPTLGLMLAGSGLAIMGLREPPGDRRTRLLTGGGLCFAAATAFHLVAWFQLAAILLVVLAFLATRSHATLWQRLGEWVAFSALCTIYCVAWMLNVWSMTGSPFGSFVYAATQPIFKIGGPTQLLHELQVAAGPAALVVYGIAALLLLVLAVVLGLNAVRDGALAEVRKKLGTRSWRALLWLVSGGAIVALLAAGMAWQRHLPLLPAHEIERFGINLAIYPTALVYCLWLYLPLSLFGVGVALFDPARRVVAVRWALAALLGIMLLLVLTAVIGGANLTPFRTVMLLSTASVPIALAPLFTAAPARSTATPGSPRRHALCVGLAGLVFAQLVVAHHQRIFDELPVPKILRSKDPLRTYVADADALGTWLRSERLAPSHLEAENWIHPFEVILDDFGGLKQTVLLFNAGNPGWFARPERPQLHDPKRNVLRELVAGQLLIADRPIDSDRLREIVVIGQYHIYEGRGP